DERRLRDAVFDLEVVGLLLLEQRLLLGERRAGAEGFRGAREAAKLGEDVLAGGDADLELVPARQAQLVERVRVGRIGDGDAEGLAVECIWNSDEPFEHV